jgi:hypothetical protein
MSKLVVNAIEDSSANERYNITLGTEQASTSGTSIDFTSIPSGVKRITIMLSGVSTNGTSFYIIQIGDSGGIEASGYTGGCGQDGTASRTANSNGYNIQQSPATDSVCNGVCTLVLEDSANNTWSQFALINDRGGNSNYFSSGTKSLSAELDRVRITTVGGTDTFDAGAINIRYEF